MSKLQGDLGSRAGHPGVNHTGQESHGAHDRVSRAEQNCDWCKNSFLIKTWRKGLADRQVVLVPLHHSLDPRGKDPQLEDGGSGGYTRPEYGFPHARTP